MKTYMVGGAVRDIMLDLAPHDVDYVVVGSSPEEMLAAGFKQVGADFPVFLDDHGTEYALARTERKNGKGYVGFVTDCSANVTLEDDLMRRDLTINAMAMDDEGNIIDPFNGMRDLRNRVLKHVSFAFSEDPVRVLRLARFMARFGPEWTISSSTVGVCQMMVLRGDLNDLTRERVLKEFEKALEEPYSHLFFETLEYFGAINVLFPEFKSNLDWKTIFDCRNSTPKLKYSRLACRIEHIDDFERRLQVPNDWSMYSRMFEILTCVDSYDETEVDTLYKMDAYRRADLFNELREDIERIGVSLREFRAYDLTKQIGFDQIKDANLRGPEISAAIRHLRQEAWRKEYEN